VFNLFMEVAGEAETDLRHKLNASQHVEDQEVRDSKETLFLLLLPRQELQVHVNNLHLNLEIVGEVSEGGHMFGKPILANHMFTLAAGERTLQTGSAVKMNV